MLNTNATRKQIWLPMAALLAANYCFAQRIDPEIGRQIAAIQAIDNHAHPVLAPPFDISDREFDALPVSSFVLLHNGWPFVREMGALLQKPTVYADISSQSLTMTPHTQAQWLREWLEIVPEKVLFGTDGYPYSDELGWLPWQTYQSFSLKGA
ncbi:MAG: amidohydrolase family protein [Pseudomonadota bacterium]|nr:amidohydrolase family protein [Pseudomonadota bacterium]